jgi:formiminotetrahydrofolate cyclodeaminase
MTQQLPAEFPSRSIGDYLAALSSGAPTPGGGSAAGLAGALGCSLGAMVCNLTLAKQQDEMISTLARQFTGMAKQLIELAERDEQAFGMYRDAIALPKSAEEEKASRRTAIEDALTRAADVPLEMIDVATSALGCLCRTAEIGTSHALGDVVTGGFLVQAAALGALENVESNGSSMKVPENRARYHAAARLARDRLDAEFSKLQQAVVSRRT